jgi:hypothetical protein
MSEIFTRKFVRGHGGEFATLWSLLNKVRLFDFVQYLQALANFYEAYRTTKPLIKPDKQWLVNFYLRASQALMDMGLQTSANLNTEFLFQLRAGQLSDDALAHRAHSLAKTIELECLSIVSYHTLTKVKFDPKLPLGKKVAEKFPECSEDLIEAHECLQLDRYTACAFHMGRAMELAVKRVAKKLKAVPVKDQWQQYIDAMNVVIKKMPFKTAKEKAKRAALSSAVDYLFNFKEAWRNPTMHPKRTYTYQQANEVLSSGCSFLKHAAEKLL